MVRLDLPKKTSRRSPKSKAHTFGWNNFPFFGCMTRMAGELYFKHYKH
jgi:hypothetical protein